MRAEQPILRTVCDRLPEPGRGQVVQVVGPRGAGKSTLVGRRYPRVGRHDLERLDVRERLAGVGPAAWARVVGPAVLDEVARAPEVGRAFGRVAALPFTVLVASAGARGEVWSCPGSAGRQVRVWPLSANELRCAGGEREAPLLERVLGEPARVSELLRSLPVEGEEATDAALREAVEHVLQWGGMPALLPLEEEARREWLAGLEQARLERDLCSLVRVGDLHSFRALERQAMAGSGELLSYADLARESGVSPATARRYVGYLADTFQLVPLAPYPESLTSDVVKSPRLYWTDVGMLRHGLRAWGRTTGGMFRTMVVTEVQKWIDASGRDAECSFYRTRSGLEVDLLLTVPEGVLGLEVRFREHAHTPDVRGLCAVADALGDQWLGGLVVTAGRAVVPLDAVHRVWAVPAHRLLG